MNKIKILGIILLVAVIAVIIATVYDASTYADFETARKNPGKTIQIIGKLDKNKEVIYDSSLANLSLKFSITDNKGVSGRVVYYGTMPRDFKKLKEVVVTGHSEDTVFVAENLLLKCPTKYTNESVDMKKFE
jgi:cytochrome c-type biogenesis protein CcmE